MHVRNSDYDKALRDPKSVYDTPEQVLADPRLDRQGKKAILQTWEQDAQLLLKAEDEAMGGGEPNMLRRVELALNRLRRR